MSNNIVENQEYKELFKIIHKSFFYYLKHHPAFLITGIIGVSSVLLMSYYNLYAWVYYSYYIGVPIDELMIYTIPHILLSSVPTIIYLLFMILSSSMFCAIYMYFGYWVILYIIFWVTVFYSIFCFATGIFFSFSFIFMSIMLTIMLNVIGAIYAFSSIKFREKQGKIVSNKERSNSDKALNMLFSTFNRLFVVMFFILSILVGITIWQAIDTVQKNKEALIIYYNETALPNINTYAVIYNRNDSYIISPCIECPITNDECSPNNDKYIDNITDNKKLIIYTSVQKHIDKKETTILKMYDSIAYEKYSLP